MTTVLSYQPGQTVAIVQQVFNLDGYRQDGYDLGDGNHGAPVIARLILPNLTLGSGYPVVMTKLDTGLYYHSFILPSGAIAVGTYLVDIYWYHPDTSTLQQDLVQINVTAPFGIYSVIPGH